MQVVHVLTLGAALPAVVHDRVLTGLEDSLLRSGATRIWIEPDHPDLTVVAEFAELPWASTSGPGPRNDPQRQAPV